MPRRGRLSASFFAALFFAQGAWLLERPGLNAGELQWDPVRTIFYAIWFRLHRADAAGLRSIGLFAGALCVFCAARIAYRLGGPVAAICTGLLLSLDTSFIVLARADAGGAAFPVVLTTSGLLFVVRRWQGGSRANVVAAGLSYGLACAANPASLWTIGALALALAVTTLADRTRGNVSAKSILGFAVGCTIGLLPFFLFWKASFYGAPLNNVFSLLDSSAWFRWEIRPQPGTWGIGPKGFAQNVAFRFAGAFGNPHHSVTAIAVVLALVFAVADVRIRRSWSHALQFTALAVGGAMLAQQFGSPLLIYPLPHLLLGVAIATLSRLGFFGAVASTATVAVGALSSLTVTASFYSQLLLHGGTPEWTEGMYSLAGNLTVHDAPALYLINPEIEAPLRFLRHGMLPLTRDPASGGVLLIARSDAASFRTVDSLASSGKRRPILIREIQDFQGRAVFALFRLE